MRHSVVDWMDGRLAGFRSPPRRRRKSDEKAEMKCGEKGAKNIDNCLLNCGELTVIYLDTIAVRTSMEESEPWNRHAGHDSEELPSPEQTTFPSLA